MRRPGAGRMAALTALLLGVLVVGSGCRSTSALSSALGKENAKDSATAIASDLTWKKSTAPSSATAQEQWQNPPKNDVRAATFLGSALKENEPPPIPGVMLKDKDETRPQRTVNAQPVSLRHPGKQGGPPPGVVVEAPNAPNEGNPTLLPNYIIRPPDVLLIESQKGLLTQPIRGQHLVRPDGTVGLGIYGGAPVAGRTIADARIEIARTIHARLDPKQVKFEDVLDGLSVDVLAYNSSVYYVITDGAGLGEQVYRFPVTGNETVLDAISNINGLPVVASPRRIWVARRNDGHSEFSVFPVDWKGITQHGMMNTNWQVMPGDRIYVQADPIRRFNNNLGKILEPIERVMGATLLTGQTINVFRNNNNNNNNNFR